MPKARASSSKKYVVPNTRSDSEEGYDTAVSSNNPTTGRYKMKSRPNLKRKQTESKAYVDRWIEKMRENEDLNLVFVQILGEIQENIIDRLEILENNLSTSLQQKFSRTRQDEDFDKVYLIDQLENCKQILNIELPINDLKEFLKFDESLDDSDEKLDAFKNLILCVTAGSNHIGFDISTIMHSVIAQAVRLVYSGAGRIYHGKQKRNFSITNVYQCMEDVLVNKYKKSAEELKIKNRVCRWFSTRNYYY